MIRFNYLLALIFLISSCSNNYEVKKEGGVLVVNSEQEKIDSDTTEIIIQKPIGLNFEIIGDSVYFKNGDSLIVSTNITPTKWVDKEAGISKIDQVSILSNCLIVKRGLEVGGEQLCGTLPSVEQIEAFTQEGIKVSGLEKHRQSFFWRIPWCR